MPLPSSVRALHQYQWGAEVANATGTYTLAVLPTAGDTYTIGGTVYTWRAAASVAGDVTIGGAVATSKTNIVAAINGTDGLNSPNPCVLAANFVANVMTLTSRVAGVGASGPPQTGNSITTTQTMTSGSNTVQQATLAGGSGTRGTLVAATSKMAIEGIIDFEPTDSVYRPNMARGLALANRGNEQVIARGTKWTLADMAANFEQFHMWMTMLTSNYVLNTGAPNVWTFTWAPTNDPSPYSWTVQRRISDGTNVDDNRFGYFMMEQFSIKTAQDKPVMFGAKGFARRIQTGTITGSLSMPNPNIPASAQVTVSFDSTWANLGVTPINAQIYASDITITTGLMPLVTSPGRSDLDFGTHMLNTEKGGISAKFTMLVSPGAQYDTEKTAAEAQTLRAVRVKIAGPTTQEIDIDMMLKHNQGSLFKLGEYNGADIVTLDLVGSTDLTNFLAITVKNGVTTLA